MREAPLNNPANFAAKQNGDRIIGGSPSRLRKRELDDQRFWLHFLFKKSDEKEIRDLRGVLRRSAIPHIDGGRARGNSRPQP
jgi:hypothetical protein